MLTGVVSVVLLGAGVVLAVPVATFGAECLIGALAQRRTEPRVRPKGTRAVVLMPAHNEERGIFGTVSALRSELGPEDEILVIADNCQDSTAEIARSAGANVLERQHPTERGKGYALRFAVEQLELRAEPPDVVIVLDADCRFTPGSVDALVSAALERNCPIQSENELTICANADTKTRIGAFAFRVKNALRPRGLARLGLPRQLAGTGMAFPWPVLRDAPNMRGHITEDLVLGLELAFLGFAPYECHEAGVYSEIAPSTEGQYAQRQRWEYGHLMAIRDYVPRLLLQGLLKLDRRLLGLGCDLSVPPLALLVLTVNGLTVVSLGSLALGAGWAAPAVLIAESAVLAAAVAIGWKVVGQDVLPPNEIKGIPRYVLWKLPSYLGFLGKARSLGWVRAERR
jgi:glycosyltransferase involved in cell wall biosynthesis